MHKVTIIPTAALGVAEQIPGEDRYNYSRAYLLARLAVMMGGHVAEELAIGRLQSTENDLEETSAPGSANGHPMGNDRFWPDDRKLGEKQPFLGYEITQGRGSSEASTRTLERSPEVEGGKWRLHDEALASGWIDSPIPLDTGFPFH